MGKTIKNIYNVQAFFLHFVNKGTGVFYISRPGKDDKIFKVFNSKSWLYNAPQISDSKLNQKKYNFAVWKEKENSRQNSRRKWR